MELWLVLWRRHWRAPRTDLHSSCCELGTTCNCNWTRLQRAGNFELVPDLHLGLRNGSARQFQHTSQLQAYGCNSKWRQAAPQLDDLTVAVQPDYINSKGHSKSMDAGRGFDPQSSSGVQAPPSEKSEHPFHGRVGQLDAISHNCAPSCIDYSEHRPQTARPIIS